MIFFVSFLIQVISAIELEQLDIDAEFSMSDIQDCDSERLTDFFAKLALKIMIKADLFNDASTTS